MAFHSWTCCSQPTINPNAQSLCELYLEISNTFPTWIIVPIFDKTINLSDFPFGSIHIYTTAYSVLCTQAQVQNMNNTFLKNL